MGDLFDDFLREVERRRAEAEGRAPRTGPGGPGDDDAAPDEPTPLRTRRAGGGRPPRPPRPGRPVGGPDDGAGPAGPRLGLWAVGGLLLVVLTLAGSGVNLWTDALWYRSVGFDGAFWTRVTAEAGLFAAGLAAALVVLLGNLWLAGRLAPAWSADRPGSLRTWAVRLGEAAGPTGPGGRPGGPAAGPFGLEGEELPDLVPLARWVVGAIAVVIALGIGASLGGAWETVALWANRVPFAPSGTVADPVFGRDISFFLFDLPFLRTAQGLLNGLLVASLVVAFARYLAAAARGGEVFVTRVRVHLAVLGGLYLLSVAFGYQLDKYELVYSTSGVAVGVGYADANARFLAYDVLTFLSGLAGALLVGGAFTRWLWPLGLIVVAWFAASILLGRLYPEAVQRFTVDPNQYAREEPYIVNNIRMTRLAFGIEDWEQRSYRGEAPLTEAALAAEDDTFASARLWDYRPLQTTLDQLQTVRQYYDFRDVDTDRYLVDGQIRQVMLSARELALERNPQATGWVNQRVIYTHGVGLAMVPVNEVTPEGQPRLWVRDLPPISVAGAPEITEPRIYFGEGDSRYVVVGARQSEFDYPEEASGATLDRETRWQGDTGIPLDSTLMRLLFGARFGDLDLVISDQITNQSQVLFRRTLGERVEAIAPFLRFDKDPYLVVRDGRLLWVQDAYTVSNRFPHATWFAPEELGDGSRLAQGGPFNYVRNSVKITMDAYDGRMAFHVADPSDPLIRAWQGVFPDLFQDLATMPEGLRAHLRVPEEQFNAQTRMFGRYHVTQPLTFFNNTDRWTVPQAQTNQQSLPTEAYYVVMRMPGESEAEFLLLQPMIAASRPNMIAWVAARNDGPNYGAVRVYQFPSNTTVFGPAQIEARIDQDPTISAQITLWSQAGSEVIRGNLIVVPIGESLVYLQPVYLQSTSSKFPEFQKIVVASPTTVVWGDSLGEALEALLAAQGGGTPGPSPTPGPTPGPTPTPGPSASPGTLPADVAALVAYANEHFELAQAALRAGDFATYGAEMDLVETALTRLGELTGASPRP